jgi:Pentapeptide repeats (9 copies)
MNLEEFKNILFSFADNIEDVDFTKKGEFIAIIRGETITAKIELQDGELYINEDGKIDKSLYWIANRVANLYQLADRILDYTPNTKHFISPNGNLLDDLEYNPSETETPIESVTDTLVDKLAIKTPGTSNVIYLTSDAGEGKTTLINEIARKQAVNFKNKKSSWLLIPIPLGGRPFLRFDDIVIASLVNRLRFRLFYYDSFIEMTKLGLLVPAFDGFEEMFMESSTGEALSATGNLMSKLNSSGSVLIASRKAYFDYKSFSSQAKLFDTIGSNSVSFSRISINRWDKDRFLLYAIDRGIPNSEEIYDFVEKKLGKLDHPLLTRPVLIKQLLDVISSSKDLELIGNSLEKTVDYFPKFVDAIIKREAETKWIDTSGEPYKPLISIEQHYDLLALIAEEMWLNNTDSLQENVLDLISDIYCSSKYFNASLSRQIKERLKQHALIIKSEQPQSGYKFDHDEFKEFFLGVAFINKVKSRQILEIKNLLRKGIFYNQTTETIISFLKRDKKTIPDSLKLLSEAQIGEGPTSFIKENNGGLIIRLISHEDLEYNVIENCIFPSSSLYGVHLKNTTFKNSYFQTTSLENSKIYNCSFENCVFDRIEYYENMAALKNIEFKDCQIICIQSLSRDSAFYDPYNIKVELSKLGIDVISATEESEAKANKKVEIDEDINLIEKAFRRFLRSTQVTDNVFRIRLGTKAEYFLKDIVPKLKNVGVLREVEYKGSSTGAKQQFKLAVPFEKINYALSKCEGKFENFLTLVKTS